MIDSCLGMVDVTDQLDVAWRARHAVFDAFDRRVAPVA
jgi:hypothetical protein